MSVDASGPDYVVAWADIASSPRTVAARSVVSTTVGPMRELDSSSAQIQGVSVACAANACAAAWADRRTGTYDLNARTLAPDASPVGTQMSIVGTVIASDQVRPRIAATDSRSLVAWIDDRAGTPSLYATGLTLDAPPVVVGDPIEVQTGLQEHFDVVGFDGEN
ncbi:MAG: hypothetical protein AAFY60_11410 [Myxococcota bacterium]